MEPNSQSSPPRPAAIKWMKLSLISFAILVVFIFGYLVYKTLLVKVVVKSFEECAKAKGSIIQETYPPVCVTKNGSRFAQKVAPVTPPLTKTEECYKKISNIKCPNGPCMPNPAAYFCDCMGGLLGTKENAKGQYGICTIDGKEYDEWDYFKIMNPQDRHFTN